ncbi:MAG TPA: mycothiol conjugate amidase Mca [Acidimicrobiales bacterium]|nr:mycothiol conjugate amidase Mca [Acidimicrobiales bacterium]
MDDRLCLLSVHAHPDDEASKGAATVAKAAADGIKTVLVCCTGGEAGDILNPAMDSDEVRDRLGEIRMEELAASVDAIGYEVLELLGYRDSGMPDSEHNAHPECFAQALLEEAVGRLVALIRQHRPHVIMTYGDDQRGYPHPDHLRVHEISVIAFDDAGDPDKYPELGEPWQPLKMYYSTWSRARMVAMHEKFLELGLESPYDTKWFDRPSQDHLITTRIDISEHYDVRTKALLAHRTQIDPESKFWFGLPPDVLRTVHPYDDYVLARSLVDLPARGEGDFEDDMFAGVRDLADRFSG